MKKIQNLISYLFSLSLIFTLLITSVEAVTYWTPGYYEYEYQKYDITSVVQMEMENLLSVTDQMMSYLRGEREDLHVNTIVNNQEREFFNEREIFHMEDVRNLFVKSMHLRNVCIILIILSIIILQIYKAPTKELLARAFCTTSAILTIVTLVLGVIISTNFTKYFTIFHEIFFSNDLWILDPRTDLLINIVPEPFFVDTALRIAIYFSITMVALFIFSFTQIQKRKN